MKKHVFLLTALVLSLTIMAQNKTWLLVGTYTGGKSKGIHVYEFNTEDGSARLSDTIATPDPSYLAVSPDGKTVFAANEEKDSGAVSAFAFDRSRGSLRLLSKDYTRGAHPCYVSVSGDGRTVVSGNYTGGSVTRFSFDPANGIIRRAQLIKHSGSGPNADRQEGPHVHAAVFSPDYRFLFTPDLGTDQVVVYNVDRKKGLTRRTSVKLGAGSGPRHLVFHPNGKWAYLVQELSGTVTAFSYAEGHLQRFQTLSILPSDFKGTFTSADIHVSPDGKFLYASNRDALNDLAIFRISPADGRLELVGFQSVLGKTPRNFSFDPTGRFLLVANQNSDEIVVFSVDALTGRLTDTGRRIEVGNPVCLKWVK